MAQRGGRLSTKYRQIAADLRARIERGEWAVDEQMPPLPELGVHYGAAHGTITKALDELGKLGMVETFHGMGTFVRKLSPERSEYDIVMSRVDELAEEIRLLRERVTQVERQRGTVPR